MKNNIKYLHEAMKEAGRCLLCEDAPCSKDCPAGTDPGRFIRQIRFFNLKGAARTIRNNNILGAVCAHTCPTERLCEKNCTAKQLGSPINISGLQRFACEHGKSAGLEPLEALSKRKGKVAVVGAGPAGLSCAAELSKMGYAVAVFEKEKSAGGVAGWGIPPYRLPSEALDFSLKNLKDLGIELSYNCKIDGEAGISGLLSKGYKAVFVATGLSKAMVLDMLGNFANSVCAADFLKATKAGKSDFPISEKIVAVIGGGAVAMDAAVTAKNMGAKKVYTISLEDVCEMPATEEELELARRAGIVFRTTSQITDVTSDGRRITGLKGIETEWKIKGNFSPANAVQVKGTEFSLKADFVIQAIGSRPEFKVSEKPGVFIGGDIARGGGTIAEAVGDGKSAAKKINEYLGGS